MLLKKAGKVRKVGKKVVNIIFCKNNESGEKIDYNRSS